MIGNAVPVKLAEFIAAGILEFADSGSSSEGQESLFDIEEFEVPKKALHRTR